jgi:hypothetical protein
MKLVFSDIAENSDEGDPSEINSDVNTIGVDDLIKDIKQMIESDDDHKDKLASYLSDIEKKMESKSLIDLANVDKSHIRKLVEKHPFFKNPNTYHIRLITIMKYLKKKGVDIQINDMDLLVDEVIQTIDGVKKIADGKYSRNRK